MSLCPPTYDVKFSGPTSFTSGLHHHTTSDCVEGIRNDTSSRGDSLGNHPGDDDVCVLGVWQHTCKKILSKIPFVMLMPLDNYYPIPSMKNVIVIGYVYWPGSPSGALLPLAVSKQPK